MTVEESIKISDLDGGVGAPEPTELLALARCLEGYIESHGEQNQPFDVLRALATLTIERVERRKIGTRFTAGNILAAAGIALPEGVNAGTKLSHGWKKLIDILPAREKGIQDFARNQGLKCYPWPEKDKSEGGRASLYFLTSRPLPENESINSEPLQPGEIAYIRELTPEPSWWAKPLIKNGYRLQGWRRWLFLSYGLGSIVLVAASLMLLWGLLWSMPTWSFKDLAMSVFASVFVIFAFWLSLHPFFRLLDWRIVMAPAQLVALGEINVQMEIVRDPAPNGPGIIRLVRYASICPQCKAKIEIADGRKEFPNRLVGRCRENPAEHVYSFDRYTCRGRSLRH
jgi:hypothetical protein